MIRYVYSEHDDTKSKQSWMKSKSSERVDLPATVGSQWPTIRHQSLRDCDLFPVRKWVTQNGMKPFPPPDLIEPFLADIGVDRDQE